MKDNNQASPPHHHHHHQAAREVEAISTTPHVPGVIAPFSEVKNRNAPARNKGKIKQQQQGIST
jgi:hypothetical protein